MWVECVNANRMRDGNFWSLDDRKHPALTLLDLLKFVLSLRRLPTSFLICLVGNGERISFLVGPLDTPKPSSYPAVWNFWALIVRDSYTSMVASSCNQNGWRWRRARKLESDGFQTHLTSYMCQFLLPWKNFFIGCLTFIVIFIC